MAPWAVGCQAPLSVGFPRKEYWNGLPFPLPEDLPNPGMEPVSCISFTAGRLFTTELSGKPYISSRYKTACDKLDEKQPLLEMFLNFSRERKVSM